MEARIEKFIQTKCKPFYDNIEPLPEDKQLYDIYLGWDYDTRKEFGFLGQDLFESINQRNYTSKISKPGSFQLLMRLGIWLNNDTIIRYNKR